MAVFSKYIPLNIFNIDTSIINSSLFNKKLSDSESLFILAIDSNNGYDTQATQKNLYFKQGEIMYAFGAPTELVEYVKSNNVAKYNYISNSLNGIDDLKGKIIVPCNYRGKVGQYSEKDIIVRDISIIDLPEALQNIVTSDFSSEISLIDSSIKILNSSTQTLWDSSAAPLVKSISILNTSVNEHTNSIKSIDTSIYNLENASNILATFIYKGDVNNQTDLNTILDTNDYWVNANNNIVYNVIDDLDKTGSIDVLYAYSHYKTILGAQVMSNVTSESEADKTIWTISNILLSKALVLNDKIEIYMPTEKYHLYALVQKDGDIYISNDGGFVSSSFEKWSFIFNQITDGKYSYTLTIYDDENEGNIAKTSKIVVASPGFYVVGQR